MTKRLAPPDVFTPLVEGLKRPGLKHPDQDHPDLNQPGQLTASLFSQSPDPMAIFDAEGTLLLANAAAENEGATPGRRGAVLMPFWADEEGRRRVRDAALSPLGLQNLEVRVRATGQSQERVFWVSACALPGPGAKRFVANAREVTQRSAEMELLKICYDELAARSDRDTTTTLYTREHFHILLERELERAQRLGRPLTLLCCDLDDFTTLNDTYGFAAGDEYLSRVGEALRERLKPGEFAGRLGGDEFALALPDTPAEKATEAAERLASLVSGLTPVYEGHPLSLTASVGGASFPAHVSQPGDLLHAANLAMQQAKRRGRGRSQIHDPEDKERGRIGRLRGQADRIRKALAEGRFLPVFQPVAEVATERIVAVETLARLRQADGKIVSPQDFIDGAERFGLVTKIDRVIIAAAFDALITQRARTAPDLEMAINLSGVDFEDDTLVHDISRLARAKGVRPERVTFEITETAVLRDLGRVQHFTRALVAEGFRFTLDDFGIGFSSFRYLRELPVSCLKFDLSYVQNLPTQVENRVFVRGIAEICRGLGVKTVAEGVESSAILSVLRELGVDRAQGHYIGHPSEELPLARPQRVRYKTNDLLAK